MNWEAIAKQGYEVFHAKMRMSGVRVGVWEGLTVAERMALVAQAQEISIAYSNASILQNAIGQ